MTSKLEFIDFLQAHKAGFTNRNTVLLNNKTLLEHINEGIRQAVMLLIEAREPWMHMAWNFDVVADQKVYLLSAIALAEAGAGKSLSTLDNFARPHSLSILSEDGLQEMEYGWVDRTTGIRRAGLWPKDRTVRMELVPTTSGDREADFQLTFDTPSDYTLAAGGRFVFYCYPRRMLEADTDGYTPALPAGADRLVKLLSLRSLHQSAGNDRAVQAMTPDVQIAELRFRESFGGHLSDEPQYVATTDEDEWWPV